MKAIIENNKTYKVTGERGDFTICEDNKGKSKMFQTSIISIVEIEKMPKAKNYKNSIGKVSKKRHAEFQSDIAEATRLNHAIS